jgi:hypothetical protein
MVSGKWFLAETGNQQLETDSLLTIVSSFNTKHFPFN